MKDALGIEDVEDDEEFEEEAEEKKPTFITSTAPEERPMRSYAPAAKPDAPAAPAVSTKTGRFTTSLRMEVTEPREFNDSPRLVDSLKAKKPVIINLENLDTDVAKTIFDFLSGATYALNGKVQRITNNIFLFAPENVDVSYNQTQKAASAESGLKSPWK